MKRLLIALSIIAFLFPFCPKTVGVALAQETVRSGSLPGTHHTKHITSERGAQKTDSSACCSTHQNSGAVSYVTSESRLLNKALEHYDGLPTAFSDLDLRQPVSDMGTASVRDPEPFFCIDDFERRSEVIRR